MVTYQGRAQRLRDRLRCEIVRCGTEATRGNYHLMFGSQRRDDLNDARHVVVD